MVGLCLRRPQSLRTMVLLLVVLLGTVSASSLRYDQTQTGDTNIHLQVKNVEVLALLEDSGAEEYDYDYSDFTEKPLKPVGGSFNSTTGSSNSTTGSSNSTTGSFNSTTGSSNSNTTLPESSEISTVKPAVSDSSTASDIQEPLLGSTSAPDPGPAAAPAAPQTTKRTRRCGAGFYRDTSGRCRRIRRPHLQMLMNLARSQSSTVASTS